MKPYEPSSLCTGLGDYWIIWRCDSCSYSCLLLVSPLSHQILHQNSGWLPNSYIHRDQSISPLNGAFCQIALFCWPPDQVVWCWPPLADDAGDNSNTDQAAFNLAMLTAGKSQVSEWCYMYESVLDLAEVESVFCQSQKIVSNLRLAVAQSSFLRKLVGWAIDAASSLNSLHGSFLDRNPLN